MPLKLGTCRGEEGANLVADLGFVGQGHRGPPPRRHDSIGWSGTGPSGWRSRPRPESPVPRSDRLGLGQVGAPIFLTKTREPRTSITSIGVFAST